MAISMKDVEKVARLARLALTEEEKENFRAQLSHILDYMEKLKKVDTSSLEATAHPFITKTGWREDQVFPWGEAEKILKNSPEKEETFFKVKKVIE
ncbi:MAG: Asp-tRNA(Asn)/Glu-tRNA(Gln) amidotransferase subunit GatC [Elusimicrobia bacterium]|nr:Asp-tRNA(Asn)/Glu-tRNA(Gln) amidotransferase subunit GatC [Elusimicrobiota bacterium]